jgi:hypothetical protein
MRQEEEGEKERRRRVTSKVYSWLFQFLPDCPTSCPSLVKWLVRVEVVAPSL